jgi:hypothetical protein
MDCDRCGHGSARTATITVSREGDPVTVRLVELCCGCYEKIREQVSVLVPEMKREIASA